ncbi:class I SAM-dependent methyltransferase [Nocardia terpenica]|uniref:Methyltransferase type 11 n=1 Tax=Nocardia terpenica TaxID=455432 RepID=A0A164NS66_9NOCA|nr:methyltransferase domain-containing protein [Nocardia terpenica]KZM74663.1 methyltransferase type 11 [Nocardia terpenica]NQE93732.1 methyltransferase domain-containing protein [Nocardia terpenica]
MTGPDPADIKTCCVQAYERDAVALLLGDSYHPGGARLTRRLADRLALRPGQRVLDIACGPGATAVLLAAEYGVEVEGIDLAAPILARAEAAVEAAGLTGRVRFQHADSEATPFAAGVFDAVVCECALCLFPDKPRAASEFARVLRPGGRLGITDVTVADSGLPAELTDLAAHIACIADARPVTGYLDLLAAAGLRVTTVDHHDTAITTMIDHIQARLNLLRITAPEALTAANLTPTAAVPYVRAARRAVTDGRLGYALIVAEKPSSPHSGRAVESA